MGEYWDFEICHFTEKINVKGNAKYKGCKNCKGYCYTLKSGTPKMHFKLQGRDQLYFLQNCSDDDMMENHA